MGEIITGYGEEAGICGHDGTDWIKVKVDDEGKLQIDIDTSVLPSGAATAANQTTMITALQLIDDLRNALDSVGTDELDVNVEASVLPTGAATSANQSSILTELEAKLETADLNIDAAGDLQVDVKTAPTTTVQSLGGDKLFAYESVVADLQNDTDLDAGLNTLDSTAVGTGKVWVITNAAAEYTGTVPTEMYVTLVHDASSVILFQKLGPDSGQWYDRQGWWVLDADDTIRVAVVGATAGDDLRLRIVGFQMDAP